MSDTNTKAEVRALLDQLPDDVAAEDVLYHLYVKVVLEQRLAAGESAETVPHDEVVEEFRQRWLSRAG